MKTNLLARLRAHLIAKQIEDTAWLYNRFADESEWSQRQFADDKINHMTNIELLEALDEIDSPADAEGHE